MEDAVIIRCVFFLRFVVVCLRTLPTKRVRTAGEPIDVSENRILQKSIAYNITIIIILTNSVGTPVYYFIQIFLIETDRN